jgi:hypothetical protein
MSPVILPFPSRLPFTTNSTVLGVVLRPGIVKSVLQVKSGILGGVKLYFRACLFSYTKSFTLSWWLRVGDFLWKGCPHTQELGTQWRARETIGHHGLPTQVWSL